MTTNEREKAVAVCDECEIVCAVWRRPDGTVVPVSARTGCECDDPELRVLTGEALR